MRHAARARTELGIKSAMNLVGPLSNPADASYQLIGVFDAAFCGPVAEAAHMLGVRRVMVVHGEDGLDEISVSARTLVVEIDETGRPQGLCPQPGGVRHLPVPRLRAPRRHTPPRTRARPSPSWTAAVRMPIREAVLLNAGASLYICGIARNIGDGYLRAAAGPRVRGGALRAHADPGRSRPGEGERCMSVLERIVERRRERVAQEGHWLAARALASRAAPLVPFGADPFLVCEVKRRSPPAATSRPGSDAVEQARALRRPRGAKHLRAHGGGQFRRAPWRTSPASRRPCPGVAVLRKDFLLDEEDIEVSWRAGADAVLLIARLLDEGRSRGLHGAARRRGLAALVEVHDAADVDALPGPRSRAHRDQLPGPCHLRG